MKPRYLLLVPALVILYLSIGCMFRGPEDGGHRRDHGHGDHEHDR